MRTATENQTMTAPLRPPFYTDAIGGRDDVPAAEAVAWFTDTFVSKAKWCPDWIVEDRDIPIDLAAADEATIAFSAAGIAGTVRFGADPSGWLTAVATVGGREVFRGFVERAYEAYEVWPPGAGTAEGEAPGTIGKRADRVNLAAEAWPALRPLADGGHVSFVADEARLRIRMDAEGRR